jgi:hypothetical protein
MNLKNLKYDIPRIAMLAPPAAGLVSNALRSHTGNPAISVIPAVWPPLGSIELFAAAIATLLISAFSYLPSTIDEKAKAKHYTTLSIRVAVIAIIIYVGLLAKFVKEVPTNIYGIQYRSIGYQRTANALSEAPNRDDVELLKMAGLDDAGIEKAWTPFSVWIVRIGLFVSYVGGLGALSYYFGSLSHQSTAKIPQHTQRMNTETKSN